MNTHPDFDMQTPSTAMSPLQAVFTTSLAQEANDVVRHLVRVLDVKAGEHVLLISADGGLAAVTLAGEYGCRVSVLAGGGETHAVQPAGEGITLGAGTPDSLPFADETFDAAIVAIPITARMQSVARELARVLKHSGRLGVVAFSFYRDQVTEGNVAVVLQSEGAGKILPAAAYRAILAEAGFTAFLSENRRRELRRSAQAIYREHMLEPEAPAATALGLLAAGGVSMTLITAEKGI